MLIYFIKINIGKYIWYVYFGLMDAVLKIESLDWWVGLDISNTRKYSAALKCKCPCNLSQGMYNTTNFYED